MRNQNAVAKAVDNTRKIAALKMFGLATFATLVIQLALIADALAGQ